ncbi:MULTISPECIES: helix-turn-helix transcriptional regulator [Pandoraea]|uniref:XRE family transcriptional regulator n=2 Tax=Pandoraea TaxID=93217 RepID=A0A5E4XJH9_9BURK|nr:MULTISPECIES: helix-turn-helix transcriptional regulator [Pandoraea]VVE18494.1 XRE family transcriptional regulator [Pandoraea cepalis]VVE36312.1 XRE family transcriptional regulator [Pandoraea terrigena]
MAILKSMTPDQMVARVGENIKALRLQRNIDQLTLAERAGVSRSALKNLENGSGCTLRTLVSVLRALGQESWIDSLAPVATINPMTMPRSGVTRTRASVKSARRSRSS